MIVTGATTGVIPGAERAESARRGANERALRRRIRALRPLLVFERRHRLLGDCVASALANSGLHVDRLEPPCRNVELTTVCDHPLIVVDSVVLVDDAGSDLVDEITECDADVLVVGSDPSYSDAGGQHYPHDVVAATDDLVTLVSAVHRLLRRAEAEGHAAGQHRLPIALDETRELFASLSRREQTVLDSMMSGLSAVEIAEDQFVSVTTVRSQIRSILTKLNVRSQLAAVALAHEAGWVANGRRIHQI